MRKVSEADRIFLKATELSLTAVASCSHVSFRVSTWRMPQCFEVESFGEGTGLLNGHSPSIKGFFAWSTHHVSIDSERFCRWKFLITYDSQRRKHRLCVRVVQFRIWLKNQRIFKLDTNGMRSAAAEEEQTRCSKSYGLERM